MTIPRVFNPRDGEAPSRPRPNEAPVLIRHSGYSADLHSGRIMLSRGELTETDDQGDFQTMDLLGHAEETFKGVGRNLPFGFTSHCPPGSIGHILSVSGRRDAAWALGFEHPQYRPRKLGVGESVLYNQHGEAVSLIKKNIRIVSARVDINP